MGNSESVEFRDNVTLLFGGSNAESGAKIGSDGKQTTDSATENTANSEAYNIEWTSFYRSNPATQKSFSLEDIFSAFDPSSIRKLLKEKPNLASSLLMTLIDRICLAVSEHAVIVDVAGKVTLPKWEERDSQEVVQAVRILCRFMPFVFEADNREFEKNTFWNQGSEGATVRKPLAVKLVKAAIDLLFMPAFTMPEAKRESESDPIIALSIDIWESGLVKESVEDLGSFTIDMKNNREDLIRLLLVLMSRIMYISTNKVYKMENRWATLITSGSSRNRTVSILVSLMNTFLKFDPSGAWSLYGSRESDSYIACSSQLLMALLDYSFPSVLSDDSLQAFRDKDDDFEDSLHESHLAFPKPTSSSEADSIDRSVINDVANNYTLALESMSLKEDFSFIMDKLLLALERVYASKGSYFKGSVTKIFAYEQDLIILLWKIMELSKPFYNYFVSDGQRSLAILAYLLHFTEMYKADITSNGFVHISSFILILLSGEREFCVNLNTPIPENLLAVLSSRSDPKSPYSSAIGTYGDAIMLLAIDLISVHKSTLTECLLTVLVNISPFLKTVGLTTSQKLVSLLSRLSHPSLLLHSEDSYRFLGIALDVINNLILYQSDGNTRLVYVILREASFFKDLSEIKMSDLEARKDAYEAKIKSNLTGAAAPKTKLINITETWFETFQSSLRLKAISQLVYGLGPKVDQFCLENEIVEEEPVIEFLAKLTLVGLLPIAAPISIRKYKSNVGIRGWLTSYYYGNLYLKLNDPPLWLGTEVRLFQVRPHTP